MTIKISVLTELCSAETQSACLSTNRKLHRNSYRDKSKHFPFMFQFNISKIQKALEIKRDVCLQNTTNHYCCSGKVNIQKKHLHIKFIWPFFSSVF